MSSIVGVWLLNGIAQSDGPAIELGRTSTLYHIYQPHANSTDPHPRTVRQCSRSSAMGRQCLGVEVSWVRLGLIHIVYTTGLFSIHCLVHLDIPMCLKPTHYLIVKYGILYPGS